MNRRGFIGMLVGGVAASAAVRTFPFRVFSFPSEIKIAQPLENPAMWQRLGYKPETLEMRYERARIDRVMRDKQLAETHRVLSEDGAYLLRGTCDPPPYGITLHIGDVPFENLKRKSIDLKTTFASKSVLV